jgi:hypothetical protein
MRNVMFALAIVAGAFMAVGPASAQCTYRMNDKGRSHGYLGGPCNGSAVGYAGAYPGHLNPAAQAHPTINAPKVTPQVNRHVRGCDWLCQRKCQATWQRGGLPSVEACYAKWSRLNANETARQCEAANRARLAGQPKLPGC